MHQESNAPLQIFVIMVCHKSTVDQDCLQLKYMNISIPVPGTKKECDNHKPKSVALKYKIRKHEDKTVPVCAKLFMDITGKKFTTHY